jgi:hypothetical protein
VTHDDDEDDAVQHGEDFSKLDEPDSEPDALFGSSFAPEDQTVCFVCVVC